MPRLVVRLLGGFQAALDDRPLAGFESNRVRCLCAYLMLEAGREHTREELAALLWPEQPDQVGRDNLRQALANLRSVVGDRSGRRPFFLITREAIRFDSESDYWLDAADFSACLDACRGHPHRRAVACRACAERLARAAELYLGDLLAQLRAGDSADFEDWLLLRREDLHRRALEALAQLAEHHQARGAYDSALRYALRQVELEPWREEAHRQAMLAFACLGRRSAALIQYERCRRALAAELDAVPSPETTDIADQLRSAAGPSPCLRPALRNWPAMVTPFVGRQSELAGLAEMLAAPGVRLITLAGLVGAGKTRLAVRAAEEEAAGFRDGACFAAATRPALLVPTIANALGIHFASGADQQAELIARLRRRELLLVLDNCEGLAGRAELLAELLRGCPGLVVLATSRTPLQLTGESLFWVAGLPRPPAAGRPGFAESEAVLLFVQSARRARPGYTLSEADAAAVRSICALVDGLPLAIELAAAWLAVLPCTEIPGEIEASLAFLSSGPAGAADGGPAGTRSLYAVLEQTWQMLDPASRRVLCGLAVFRGGFRREAAAAVLAHLPSGPGPADSRSAGVALLTPGPILPALAGLVQAALLAALPSGRYHQHALVRRFAEEKLATWPAGEAAARGAHAEVYITYLAGRGAALRGSAQAQALAELDEETENLRVAWRAAHAARRWDLIASCLESLMAYYDVHGWREEALAALEEAVAALSDKASRPAEEGFLLGDLLAYAGLTAYQLNRHRDAEDLARRSLDLLASAAWRPGMAVAYQARGYVAFWQGDYAAAARHFAAGLDCAEGSADAWRAAVLRYLLGDCASVTGDHARAGELYEASLAAFRRLGDPRMIALALSNQADGLRRAGRAAEARPIYQDSIARARELVHPALVVDGLNGLAEIAYDLADYGEAYAQFTGSLDVARETDRRRLSVLNLAGLGATAAALGDRVQAVGHLVEALALAEELGSVALLTVVMIGVAALLALGDAAEREAGRALLTGILDRQVPWQEYRRRAERILASLDRSVAAAAPLSGSSGVPLAAACAWPEAGGPADVAARLLGRPLPPEAITLFGPAS